ncbi:MAG: twitching motility protein [Planctomycetota bacterium]|nr:MAG: twitching motility protein [Planctomycetota bacterium]
MASFSDDDLRDGVTDQPLPPPPAATPTPTPSEPPAQVSQPPQAEAPAPEAKLDQDDRCYTVGGNKVSILDLLRLFSEGEHQEGGMSRLADLHLKVGHQARYRHDGRLVPLQGADNISAEVAQRLVYPLMRQDQIEKLEQDPPIDIDAGYHHDGMKMDFRINVFHDRDGLAMVVRALPRQVPATTDLGFPDHEVVEQILRLRQGLVVVTGITGSGKSTTIASLLSELNRRSQLRVITLEDPVEYVLKADQCLVSQREVGRNCATFSGGLRSALREDPDVIFLGEIRDTETANLALSAAETGHLVFTTLHTRDAKGVVTRIVDLFPAERSKEVMSQLSFSLSFVIAQKLLPRKDGVGRAASFEVMRNVSAISNLIRTGAWHQIYATMQLSAKDRMITMERHLQDQVAAGLISLDTALQYANDPAQLQSGKAGAAVAARRPKI